MFWVPNTIYHNLQKTSRAVSNLSNISYPQVHTSQHLFIPSDSSANVPYISFRTAGY